MPPLRKIGSLVLLSLVVLTGCETAHVVKKDAYGGGVVAIPDNSNSWPFYHRDKALALIKQECPDYVIVGEERVVTGVMTTNRDSTETRNQDLTPRNSPYGATATTTDRTHTIETRDRTEYRITFAKKGTPAAMAMSLPPPGPPVQPVRYVPPTSAYAPPTPIPAQPGLPPAPIPISVGGQ